MLDFTKGLCPDRPLIHPTSQTKDYRLGHHVEIGDHCVLEETEVGDYIYCFGSNDIIYTTLGKFNSIATNVCINPVRCPAKFRATVHHFTYRYSHYGLRPDDVVLIDWRRQNHQVVTGNDVWPSHNAVLMSGAILGGGAVMGTGAAVAHDVAPYKIMGEVPVWHIGWHYPPELITAMERTRWWDWSHSMLRERLRSFDNMAAFCRKFDPQQKARTRCFHPESNGPLC